MKRSFDWLWWAAFIVIMGSAMVYDHYHPVACYKEAQRHGS